MKNVKTEQMIYLIIATLFTAGLLFVIKDSGTTTGIAWAFTTIVGAFIGLDLAVMIKKTSEMTAGHFKEINKYRYITSLVIFALLLGESFYLASIGRNCDGLYASFGMGFLLIIGGLVAGVEGNKIVTNHEPAETETK
jgi:hypothetical protein